MAVSALLSMPLFVVAGTVVTTAHVCACVCVLSLLALTLWMRLPKEYQLVLPLDIKTQVDALDYPSYRLPRVCLVTGGNGFLGRNIVNVLRRNGVRVIVFDIAEGRWSDSEVVPVRGDLCSRQQVADAIATHGVEMVFHVASPDPNSPNKALFERVNVEGTRTLLEACRTGGVRAVIFTSSASVVWQGAPQEGVDESIPYPTVFRDDYARTKAAAEQIVMKAGQEAGGLITISLRPHAIFGPLDRTLLPTTVALCKAGRQGTVVGDGENVVDWTFVNNVVHSHMLAAQTAWEAVQNKARCGASGRTYFITNGEPMKFWEFMNWLFLGMGFSTSRRRIPYSLVLVIAYVAQFVVGILNRFRPADKPISLTLSPSRLQISGTAHWYNISAARRDLNYKPIWNMQQAIYITLKSFANIRNTIPPVDVLRKARAGNLTKVGLIMDWEAAKTAHIEDDSKFTGPRFREMDDPEMPFFTMEEVAKHASMDDAWIVVDGYVYNVTRYLKVHQPGPEPLLRASGKDASVGFHGPQHPEHAPTVLAKYLIGKVKA